MITNIDQLLLCLTRRCNMACRHCLRGDAQCKDMSETIIRQTFKGLTDCQINTLFLTGGEITIIPTATLKRQLTLISSICNEQRISIGSIGFVSNGKKVTQKFTDLIVQFALDLNISGFYIGISETQYHDTDRFDDRYMLHALGHRLRQALRLDNEEEASVNVRGELRDSSIIIEGRAHEDLQYAIQLDRYNRTIVDALHNKFIEIYGIEFDKLCDSNYITLNQREDKFELDGEVYVGATGNITFNCDFSYESEEDISFLNLVKLSKGKTTHNQGLFEVIEQVARFGNDNRIHVNWEKEQEA